MRIIAGKYKGRHIKVLKCIRPTQGKVKKALFDILGDINGLSFLELFAGSGQVGLEALSRGVKEVVFIEKDLKIAKIIKENLSLLGYSHYRVITLDVLKALKNLDKQGKKFDIVFLDPPYYKGLAKKTLQSLGTYDILAGNGFIVVQHFKKDILSERINNLTKYKEARYGDALLSFYKKII